jgi:L-histidine N-alpha-methyltransferase
VHYVTTIQLDRFFTDTDAELALNADARAGLTSCPKTLSPQWFYDARGSALFKLITGLPEYYPTRTELALLRGSANQIAALSDAQTVVELGSGPPAKTRLLLDAFIAAGTLRHYIPFDVSSAALRESLNTLACEYPGLKLHGVVGDFTRHLDLLPRDSHRMIAFLGGTIGNLLPAQRAEFLAGVRRVLDPGEQLLIGAGLVTDPAVMIPAYDDAAGVTAEFNRNVLHVLNRQLGADFDVEAFTHVALWDEQQEWIEMRLRADRAMRVTLADLGLVVEFAAGEELRTEVSAKFRPNRMEAELTAAGFWLTDAWTDRDQRFMVALAFAV